MQKTYEDLEQEIEDQRVEIETLEKKVSDLEGEVEELEDDVKEAENAEPDIDNISREDIEAAFYANCGINSSMVNDMKLEKFFTHFDKFTLEQFEDFLREVAKIQHP